MAMRPGDMLPSNDQSTWSPALRAAMAYLSTKNLQPTADNIRSAISANSVDPGDAAANGPNLGPVIPGLRNAGIEDASPMPSRGGGGGGNTSAAPSGSVTATPPKFYSDSAASQPLPVGPRVTPPAGDAGGGGGSLLQSLVPLLAGGGAASFPLGRYILDRARAGGAIEAGPRLSTTGPGFAPEYGAGGTVPSGPGFDPEYGPARPTTPPTQPAPGPRAPVEPVVPPIAPTAPTGAGFSPEYGASPATAPVPPTDASAAVDKAIGGDAPAPRARAPRAKALRIRPPKL